MPANLSFSRDMPVRQSVDVLVAGGGPAGVAAAVTAARQGARVCLIEAQNCLGGMGTAGMLPVFMPFADGTHFYAGGFGRELYDRMEAADGFWPNPHWGRLCPQIRAETLKRIYDTMALEAGVSVSLMTQAVAVEVAQGRISHVICAAKSGLFAIATTMVVDATGDGDLAAWAGAPFEKGDANGVLMPGTLCSLWGGIDWSAVERAGQDREAVIREALEQDPGLFTTPDLHLVGILPVGPQAGGGNVGHLFGVDGTDESSMTRALVQGRRSLTEYEVFYRRYMTGYENASILATAPLVGIRETRRILGDYVLNTEDFDNRASFHDEIGRYNYWIDRHPEEPDTDKLDAHNQRLHNAYRDGESYGIPYRILTPRTLSNVLVAGRCVSTDRNVQASIRVMPGCYITGQAAGMAAAMASAASLDTRSVPVAALQAKLHAMGAFLPNFTAADAG
jgi:hypothetical protein